MKKLLLFMFIFIFANCCFADTETTKEKVNCDEALKNGYVFIPTTIPQECLQSKQKKIEEESTVKKDEPKTKLGKFINFVLEE